MTRIDELMLMNHEYTINTKNLMRRDKRESRLEGKRSVIGEAQRRRIRNGIVIDSQRGRETASLARP